MEVVAQQAGAAIVAASDAGFVNNVLVELRNALRKHVEEHTYSHVKLIENTVPINNPDEDDYSVAYEAIFEPSDLEHAYLKIAITVDGYVQIGFETRARLAERLGSNLWTARKAFAAGRELVSTHSSELVSFVRLVAQGGVMLRVGFGFGLLGFGSIRAVVSPGGFQSFGLENPRNWDWLKVLSEEQSGASWQTIVRYKPW